MQIEKKKKEGEIEREKKAMNIWIVLIVILALVNTLHTSQGMFSDCIVFLYS